MMLSRDLEKYIDRQRSLGFKFRVQNILLRGFVVLAEECGDKFVKSDRAIAWATLAPSPEQRRNRLLTVRGFAIALQAENDLHQVPAADALGTAVVKRRPRYIYAPSEIARLLRTAATLRDQADDVRDAVWPPRRDRDANRGSLGHAPRRRDR